MRNALAGGGIDALAFQHEMFSGVIVQKTIAPALSISYLTAWRVRFSQSEGSL
jgi:hypothetical protein